MREKLTAVGVAKQTKPGRFGDGGGLYLLVKPDGRKTWVFRWRDKITGKLRDKGLGPYGKHDVTLAKARERAGECRNMVWEGNDPIEEARLELQEKKLAFAMRLSFKDCVDRYIDSHKAGWKNKKHADQWPSSLNNYASNLMSMPVAEIDQDDVLACLEPIWQEKTVTATRVRQRIECVLDWATARKYREGENPARWKGHLNKILPKPSKLKKVVHLAALDYSKIGQFMQKLRAKDTLAAKAFEFQILTATRPGEAMGARWSEIDLEAKVWAIPEERMKADVEHKIPLSPQALELLKSLPRVCDFIFPSPDHKKGLTTIGSMRLLRDLNLDVTAHAMRSTFRDWSADLTNYQREVCEHALAHQLKNGAEGAYHRKAMFPKRVNLMNDWANYCDTIPTDADNVTPIRKGAKS
jgi:integrase